MSKPRVPFGYYGGKQLMAKYILPNIPKHRTYVETFSGGAAIFWLKEPSHLEVLNDTNRELINFYEVVKNDYAALESKIRVSMHSRDLYRKASTIYRNPDMFNHVERAWAIWLLAVQGYGGMIDSSFGRDKTQNKSVTNVMNKRNGFTDEFAIRLQRVTLESRDAVKLINSIDYADAFFYCDPPYYNADMGHYDGYTIEDFELLLKTLSQVKGQFLLSSYPSEILSAFVRKHGWHQKQIEMKVSISQKGKRKIEVLTANYPLV